MTDTINAIYMRVSSRQQTTESQKPELDVKARELEAVGEVVKWHEDNFTGTCWDRPGMNAMMEMLRARKLRRIIVWRLDRLGRTAKGLCSLFDECREFGADLVSLKDGFTLDSPAGRLHARILASVAEFETEVRAERQRAGIEAAKAIIPEIRRLADAGWTVSALARKFGKREEGIQRVIESGRLWWGGKPKGSLKKLPPASAILAYMRAGLSNEQIAAACKCGVTTLYERYPIRQMRMEVRMGKTSPERITGDLARSLAVPHP